MGARVAAVTIAGLAMAAFAQPALAYTLHQAVTLRASNLEFYAGHLVLDGRGGASLDDGVLHVRADRIILDLSKNRFVAAGDVSVAGKTIAHGAALGVDLKSGTGELVALDPAPASFAVNGGDIEPSTSVPASPEPLALPDLAGEPPFADAASAVAHLDADVRLGSARVLVPGGQNVYLPSYVYVFSSEPGYSASNVAGSGEDVPIIFGSTRDSVLAAHFTYNPVDKVGLGFDDRIVDGSKAYDLFSISPIYGPDKNAAFTWQEQIDDRASQTLSGDAQDGYGSAWSYDVNDNLHRSFLQFASSAIPGFNDETLVWQGAYEPLGAGWLGSLFSYHLRTEYGRDQSYLDALPPEYFTVAESSVQSIPMILDPSSSLALSGDWRETFYNLPQREFSAVYGATLTHRWDAMLTTSLSDFESPVVDQYPSQHDETRTYTSEQLASITYSHGDALSFSFNMEHEAGSSVPAGIQVQPWFAALDVRFRLTPSLSLDLSRSYGFGFDGQRFGSLGVQIFP